MEMMRIVLYTNVTKEVTAVPARAKVFKNGSSQAVRLPKEFRFQDAEVLISKKGDKVILEPIKKADWPKGFWDQFDQDEWFETPQLLPGSGLDQDE